MIINFKIFENIYPITPDLIVAVTSKNFKWVKKLIDTGFNVNCKDYMGWTPLLWAVYFENTQIIKMLIDAGADIYYKAEHNIAKTKKMVDFYDLAVDKNYYEGGYKKTIKWIEDNYPEIVNIKKYNL
jgi:ankyrin repeat protein